jgi:anti-sigma regulatory factor (Ser/Thr protein kinase)
MSIQSPSGPFVSVLRFAAVPTAVGCARAFVRQTLRAWQRSDSAETAVLVASELVTNAVTATGITDPHPTYAALAAVPVIRVELRLHTATLVVGVWDVSSQTPVIQPQHQDDEGGRGLLIVHAESERWGTCFFKSGGKVVWAEIALRTTDTPTAARQRSSVQTARTSDRAPAATVAG